jgi:DNA-binding MarR family transcriptional regulator
MSNTLRSISPDGAMHEAHTSRDSLRPADARSHPFHDTDDPVTEWLLDHPHINATEFAVLFAIHKLNSRRRRSGGIRRIELCRTSGLGQVSLTRVLTALRHKGLVGMSRHPVDSTRARYLLLVG